MKSSMRDHRERRDYIRMKVDALVEVKFGQPVRTLQGICRDLSGVGMAIELKEPVEVGTEMKAFLPSPNANFPSFEPLIRVVRVTQTGEDAYLIGAEIVRGKA